MPAPVRVPISLYLTKATTPAATASRLMRVWNRPNGVMPNMESSPRIGGLDFQKVLIDVKQPLPEVRGFILRRSKQTLQNSPNMPEPCNAFPCQATPVAGRAV